MRLASISAALVLSISACADSDGFPVDPTSSDLISLAVRIHLLQSDQSDALNTTLTDAEVETMIAGVNDVWAQANIEWRVEFIIRESARNPDTFEDVLRGNAPLSPTTIASILPTTDLLSGKWDVFMIKDFGGLIGGAYLTEVPATVSAEIDPSGTRDIAGSGARILAHELGHSLGLFHTACTSAGNLMSPGCVLGDRTGLTATQVAATRAQASTGRPF